MIIANLFVPHVLSLSHLLPKHTLFKTVLFFFATTQCLNLKKTLNEEHFAKILQRKKLSLIEHFPPINNVNTLI